MGRDGNVLDEGGVVKLPPTGCILKIEGCWGAGGGIGDDLVSSINHLNK